MAPTVLDIDELLAAKGRDLGLTAWRVVEPLQLRLFAAATGAGPAGDGVPAQPYFALSLTNLFLPELLQVGGAASGINYGTGAARFGSPIRPGDRVRGAASLVDAEEVPGGVQTTIEIRVDVQDRSEPACVVASLSRWIR